MTTSSRPIGERALGRGLVIAIDGPSGSGKSTVARTVAADISASYLDTGAMYRALTWSLLHRRIDVTDHARVASHARECALDIDTAPYAPRFAVGGVDVTQQIRGVDVTSAVSEVAANPEVRSVLIASQRHLIAQARESGKGMVAEGRDITTVVAPDADVRILITASAEERERRRRAEAGEASAASMARRDARDSQVNDFITPSEGVTLIDTTQMTLPEVVNAVLALIDERV
ncbi:(d)CMP kinase [Nanchangia anserum]|uniref:Cytidylate kinase n=1 Tax=Nanchangia anserum TaxID=2692125 RepID=A0A8I0KPC2_9ACTO|nr:(d)CMP kinase [Nanchangia anserum]QOX82473.1 (d)CMP kinase [Nanchangia anserum]